MKSSKGFTLVELIAIIVIVGIIIGIIAPVSIKLIEKSKTNSFRESLRSIIRSTEIYMSENDLKTLPSGEIYLESNDLDLDYAEGYKGIIKYENGELILLNVSNGKYCGNGSIETLAITNYDSNCVVDPADTKCFIMGTTEIAGDTIIGYDYKNASCSSTDIKIPATVNKIPVKYIAEGAFLTEYVYKLAVGMFDFTPLGAPFQMPIMDLESNLEYLGIPIQETYYLNNLSSPMKMCMGLSEDPVLKDISYEMTATDGFVLCSIDTDIEIDESYYASGIGLTSVDFSNAINLVEIGQSAFSKNYLTGTLDLSGAVNLTKIGSNAFAYNQLETAKFPSNLLFIGAGAFKNNSMITITIPSSVTTIENLAFSDNAWVSVTIEENATNNKFRFNDNWGTIGWPSSLMTDISPINYVLNTSVNNFAYSGTYFIVDVPTAGNYKLEVWGAQGSNNGGNGGYSVGNLSLTSGTKLYVYVGGQNGYNGGGGIGTLYSGGGASDIRINSTSLLSRVIVAGGGGAGSDESEAGYGGGTVGGNSEYANGATATAGGTGYDNEGNGSFGIGGWSLAREGSGGGGWYGGGADELGYSGAGGSGYVYTSATSSNYPSGCLLNSSNYLTSATTIGGNTSVPTFTGAGSMTGNTGNGYIKITYIG